MTESTLIVTLVVYGREDCHLCQEMIHALHQYKEKEQVSFHLEISDIDSHPELVELYNEKVPVLMAQADNKEICHYHLDSSALDAYFAKIR